MTQQHRYLTTKQLAITMAGFVVCALLLESGGLADWAERLDLGPLRSVSYPMAEGLHHALAPLGLETLRTKSITALARAGWSDDPAAAAEDGGSLAGAAGAPTAVTLPVPPATGAGVVPENKLGAPLPPIPERPLLPMKGDPPLESALPPLALPPAVAASGHMTVALAGDSMMAVGISATLLRQATKHPEVKFVRAFKSGTGLARPEVFNWQAEYPAMIYSALGQATPDLVIVAIGANDGQGFVDSGITYPFGGDGWRHIYQERVQAYLAMLTGSGAKVLWLGLPPMKSEVYGARIALINRITYAVVSQTPGVTWFSTADVVGNSNGTFRDFGDVDGKPVRLRAGDGIHMSDDGATLVTEKLLPWLDALMPPPVLQPTPAPAVPSPATSSPAAPSPGGARPVAPNSLAAPSKTKTP